METIRKTLETKIASLKNEIVTYQVMLGMCKGASNPRSGFYTDPIQKRGPVIGSKRGPYKARKTKKVMKITRKFKKSLASPDWRTEIPKILAKSGPLTYSEIVTAISPRSHSKTKKVLNGRCSAILSLFKKEGLVKAGPEKDGVLTFTV